MDKDTTTLLDATAFQAADMIGATTVLEGAVAHLLDRLIRLDPTDPHARSVSSAIGSITAARNLLTEAAEVLLDVAEVLLGAVTLNCAKDLDERGKS